MLKAILISGIVCIASPVIGFGGEHGDLIVRGYLARQGQGTESLQKDALRGGIVHYDKHVGDITPEPSPTNAQQQKQTSANLLSPTVVSSSPSPSSASVVQSPSSPVLQEISLTPFDSKDSTGLTRVVVRPRTSPTTETQPQVVDEKAQAQAQAQSSTSNPKKTGWLYWICCCGCCE